MLTLVKYAIVIMEPSSKVIILFSPLSIDVSTRNPQPKLAIDKISVPVKKIVRAILILRYKPILVKTQKKQEKPV